MRARDCGSVTIELAILAPSLLLVASFAMLVGRLALSNAALDAATYSGARAASLARDASTAQGRAESSIHATLDAQDINCLNLIVDVDTTQFARDVGEPASVIVTVECRVDLSAGAMPGMPTSRWITATYSSPLDLFRSRAG
ncbi:pilus assembly protein [Micromonospora zingiberis]|uniref:Pilus assembly protein n=1 Tax=Micromonospora zingiberis TaxID=2053011 RepID=A0A4R0G1F8_9ACTN|nr:TadE family protein [Micromonospora zingiberis]TCB89413.1 pilus assembly protein [Micromonospora zingiberis]